MRIQMRLSVLSLVDGPGSPGLEAELAKARIDALRQPGAYNLKLWVKSAVK